MDWHFFLYYDYSPFVHYHIFVLFSSLCLLHCVYNNLFQANSRAEVRIQITRKNHSFPSYCIIIKSILQDVSVQIELCWTDSTGNDIVYCALIPSSGVYDVAICLYPLHTSHPLSPLHHSTLLFYSYSTQRNRRNRRKKNRHNDRPHPPNRPTNLHSRTSRVLLDHR